MRLKLTEDRVIATLIISIALFGLAVIVGQFFYHPSP